MKLPGTLTDKILLAIDKKISDLKHDRTFCGVVVSVNSATEYLINYNNAERIFKTKNALSLNMGDVVHITYPCNDSSKQYMLEDIKR